MICHLFRFIGQGMAIYPGLVFSVMVDTGIYENPFKPSLQSCADIRMPVFLELLNIFKELYETFIHDLLCLFHPVLIPVTDFHGIALKQLIQRFLACTVVFSATPNKCAYFLIACSQI